MTKRRRIASTGLSSEVLNYVVNRGHSQAEVARILRVSAGYISLVNSQKRSFTLNHLIALADGIDMPMGEMLIQATERPNVSAKAREKMDGLARVIRVGDKAIEATRADKRKKRRRVA
jgi:transcriptional regulator with XRE-family HTH domain